MSTARVNALMAQMTTEEKIGQLIQLSADFFQNGQAEITGPMQDKNLTLDIVYSAGSVLGISGAEQVKNIQKDFIEHNRLHIPLLFMADVVHGYQTIYPIPLGLGATFNPELVRQTSEVAARESAAGGVHVTFAPMVDLVRDPRWGRVMESTGEDPYLNSVLAKASVDGYQGDLPLDKEHIAACVKHFAAYGAPEAGREYNTVDLSEWRFREQYLPAYAAAIEAQAMLVMTSFNTLFGVPATVNQHLMRDILRDELNFDGVLISDWDAISEVISHGVAADLAKAADLALTAGVDIDMMSFAYAKYLEKASKIDEKTLNLINEAATRVLELKEKLGLFEDPYRGLDVNAEAKEVYSSTNLAVAQRAAEESIVLLKNEADILPLQKSMKLALVGPVVATNDLLGSWSWQGERREKETLAQVFDKNFENIQVEAGCNYHSSDSISEQQAVAAAEKQDVIVAFIGLPSSDSGEATSKTDINVPKEQLALLEKLVTLNKPIISVVVTGRPLDLRRVSELSDAVVVAWFPGSKGAVAIENILDGTVSPSGKLPMTFPRNIGQVPIYYNSYRTGRPITNTPEDDINKYQSKYLDCDNSPLYSFGFGLSYAKLGIKSVDIINDNVNDEQPLVLEVTVINESDFSAKNTLQCYTHQLTGETVRPVKELKQFKKLTFAANSEQKVQITIAKDLLSNVHTDLNCYVDSGKYEVMVGFDSDNVITKSFKVE